MPSDLNASENSNSPVSTPAKRIKLDGPVIPPTFSGVVNSKEYVFFFYLVQKAFISSNVKLYERDSFIFAK